MIYKEVKFHMTEEVLAFLLKVLVSDHLIFMVGMGAGSFFQKEKIQDLILPEKNIQDRGKRYSTLCERGE